MGGHFTYRTLKDRLLKVVRGRYLQLTEQQQKPKGNSLKNDLKTGKIGGFLRKQRDTFVTRGCELCCSWRHDQTSCPYRNNRLDYNDNLECKGKSHHNTCVFIVRDLTLREDILSWDMLMHPGNEQLAEGCSCFE